ncbi:unnamed protein product [Caenorhabditis bovis]|uniref:Dol-P-Glc:Glc(2)Man(9)GlcNAc(2)-PP-Dol alpha-1,2-glucosyltransferase n=1 Tax=Caenorhabditis bovis TaxID=2654633 RepID=A0A8S1F4K2_9PELO|nr:unnamed protein product [Caenorhabditis bovis]
MVVNPILRMPYAPITRKTDFVYAGILSGLHVIITTLVYHYVPKPYMDEIFHIGQTRAYCDGNFTWNPMITTPPALYFLSIPFCGYERYVNSIIFFFTFPAFCRFRRMFVRSDVYITALIVSILPILLQSSVLFYTDLLSLTVVIWGFTMKSPLASSIFFTVATLTRQTNIVWAAVHGIAQLSLRVDRSKPFRTTMSALYHLWPLEFLAFGFLSFIYFNNFQIVLGDAQAHKPKPHLAQFFYMVAFCAAHAWPQALSRFPSILSTFKRPNIFLLIFIAFAVYRYAFDHPYLLADNRHFTFYIWRRILSHEKLRIAFTPLYFLSIMFMEETTHHIPSILKFLFLFASIAVVVPAHLFEMRYYIVPFVIWRLVSVNHKSKILDMTEHRPARNIDEALAIVERDIMARQAQLNRDRELALEIHNQEVANITERTLTEEEIMNILGDEVRNETLNARRRAHESRRRRRGDSDNALEQPPARRQRSPNDRNDIPVYDIESSSDSDNDERDTFIDVYVETYSDDADDENSDIDQPRRHPYHLNQRHRDIPDEDRRMYLGELELFDEPDDMLETIHRELGTREVTPAFLRRRPYRNSRRVSEFGECTICFEMPMDPVGCEKCKQHLGCSKCIQQWNLSCHTVSAPSCPLCRHSWESGPKIKPMHNLRNEARLRPRNRAAASSNA